MDMYICRLSMPFFETYLWISFEPLSFLVLLSSLLVFILLYLSRSLVYLMVVLSSITKKGEIVSI